MSEVKPVLIGGGIGGLCTAIGLQQRDIQPQIYEQAKQLRPVGAGIGLGPNAMDILDRLGLAEKIQKQGSEIERVQIRNADDTVLLEHSPRENENGSDYPSICLHRSDLQKALVDDLNEDRINLGKECVGISQYEHGIAVQFSDGTTVDADVLIGADGIHSVVRNEIRPDISLRDSGQVAYRGIATVKLPKSIQSIGKEYWGEKKRFGFMSMGENKVYWFAVTGNPIQTQDPVDQQSTLQSNFIDFPSPISTLITQTEPNEIIETAVCDFAPIDSWWDNKIVLLGDAAHAMTPNLGQGAGQAIEDAYVLAKCIDKYENQSKAFRHYEQTRLPTAKELVNQSWQLGKIAYLKNRYLRTIRDFIISNAPSSIVEKQFETVYSTNY